jgi:hypothetical protein
MNHDERRQAIDEAQSKLNEAQDNLRMLKLGCTHNLVHNGNWCRCDVCSVPLGWFCPSSPDHCCHYYSVEGKIFLIDGTVVEVHPTHDPKYETEDNCIFCGEPNERK